MSLKTLIVLFSAFILAGCFFTGEYQPVPYYGYRVSGNEAIFHSDLVSFRVSGNFARPDQFAQGSRFQLQFFDITDTLVLPVVNAKLVAVASSRPFSTLEASGPGGEIQRAITLYPKRNCEISLYYHIADSSLVEPSDRIEQVAFKVKVIRLTDGKEYASPEFIFQSK